MLDNIDLIDKDPNSFLVQFEKIKDVETPFLKHSKPQLLYAEGGIIHIFAMDQHFYLPARCLMWIPANVTHRILVNSKSVDVYLIHFPDLIQDNDFYKEMNIYLVNDLIRLMIYQIRNWKGLIMPNDVGKYFFLKGLHYVLAEIESLKIPFQLQHPYPNDARLQTIAKYLLDNIEESLTLSELAHKFGTTTRTLSRRFKQDLGMSYVRFLRSLRITKSLDYIAQDKYSVEEIAYLVGFSSISSFSNTFYKVLGIRPHNYIMRTKNYN